jgi:predicted O-methyltransferase YrrM
MFEIGTCTGKTAYLWARNSPPDACVVTLTLAPEEAARYQREAEDHGRDVQTALDLTAFTRFIYTGTDVEPKIVQLYGDSKTFDFSPWEGRCDLVFVDGSHAYSYVVSDSEAAIRLARPGGIVLWHDYNGAKHSPGVYRRLNELARTLPLVHLERTMLVAYRKPGAERLASTA